MIESAKGESRVLLDPAEVKWELFGERNIISLRESGDAYITLSADREGETVLGFNYGGADVESGATVSFGTEDFLRIRVGSSDLPAAPIGITVRGATGMYTLDGAMLGTTEGMEYDSGPNFTHPTRCGNGKTEGLAAGIYYVRYAATEGAPASLAATVVIPVVTIPGNAGSAEPQGPVQVTGKAVGNGRIILSEETVEAGGSVDVTILPDRGTGLRRRLLNLRISGCTPAPHPRVR